MSNVLSGVISWILNSLAEIYNLATEYLGMFLAESIPVDRTTVLAQGPKWNRMPPGPVQPVIATWPDFINIDNPVNLCQAQWIFTIQGDKIDIKYPMTILKKRKVQSYFLLSFSENNLIVSGGNLKSSFALTTDNFSVIDMTTLISEVSLKTRACFDTVFFSGSPDFLNSILFVSLPLGHPSHCSWSVLFFRMS